MGRPLKVAPAGNPLALKLTDPEEPFNKVTVNT